MIERDLFVALVAFGLGLFVIHAAITERRICFEFWLVKRMDNRWGRKTAKVVVGIAGMVFVLLGVLVLANPSKSFRSQKSEDVSRNPMSLLLE